VIEPWRIARLLVALPSDRMGGTERHTAELARRIAARSRLDVALAADPALHPALAPLLGPGVALHAAALADPAAQAAEARRLLDTLRPDAAFVPLPWPDAADALLPVLAAAALPRLVLLHLAPEEPPRPPVALGLDGAVLAAVSAPVARRGARAWGLPEGSVAVLPNPAPTPTTLDRAITRAAIRSGLGLPPDAPLLLFVGRLEEAKGADLLPGISARLPVPIAVAGDGPLAGFLAAAAVADPRRLLRLLGPLADPAPWYAAADALLMPSRLEGAPLAFLEAAAQRCPVVGTAAALEALGDGAHPASPASPRRTTPRGVAEGRRRAARRAGGCARAGRGRRGAGRAAGLGRRRGDRARAAPRHRIGAREGCMIGLRIGAAELAEIEAGAPCVVLAPGAALPPAPPLVPLVLRRRRAGAPGRGGRRCAAAAIGPPPPGAAVAGRGCGGRPAAAAAGRGARGGLGGGARRAARRRAARSGRGAPGSGGGARPADPRPRHARRPAAASGPRPAAGPGAPASAPVIQPLGRPAEGLCTVELHLAAAGSGGLGVRLSAGGRVLAFWRLPDAALARGVARPRPAGARAAGSGRGAAGGRAARR
jgi:glycosyltransferase involved in cell wall biosynthesis